MIDSKASLTIFMQNYDELATSPTNNGASSSNSFPMPSGIVIKRKKRSSVSTPFRSHFSSRVAMDSSMDSMSSLSIPSESVREASSFFLMALHLEAFCNRSASSCIANNVVYVSRTGPFWGAPAADRPNKRRNNGVQH